MSLFLANAEWDKDPSPEPPAYVVFSGKLPNGEAFRHRAGALPVYLGRHHAPKDASLAPLFCFLGEGKQSKSISRKHATLSFNGEKQRYEMTCNGKNGFHIGHSEVAKDAVVEVKNGSAIRIGQARFYVLFPKEGLDVQATSGGKAASTAATAAASGKVKGKGSGKGKGKVKGKVRLGWGQMQRGACGSRALPDSLGNGNAIQAKAEGKNKEKKNKNKKKAKEGKGTSTGNGTGKGNGKNKSGTDASAGGGAKAAKGGKRKRDDTDTDGAASGGGGGGGGGGGSPKPKKKSKLGAAHKMRKWVITALRGKLREQGGNPL